MNQNGGVPPLIAVAAQVSAGDRISWVQPDGTLVMRYRYTFNMASDYEKVLGTGVAWVTRARNGDDPAWVNWDGTAVGLGDSMGVRAAAANAGSTRLDQRYDGTLWGVGGNASGQLGDGTKTDRTSAWQVASGVLTEGAQLQLQVNVAISVQPLSQTVFVGGSVALHAEAVGSGSSTLAFQWYKNGVPIV